MLNINHGHNERLMKKCRVLEEYSKLVAVMGTSCAPQRICRRLSEVYPVLYIDAIHYSVRDNGIIRKLAAYVILGINTDGYKEVLTIEVGKMKALNTGFPS